MIRLLAAAVVVGTIFVLSPVRPEGGDLPASLKQAGAELAVTAAKSGVASELAQEVVRREWLGPKGDAARPVRQPVPQHLQR